MLAQTDVLGPVIDSALSVFACSLVFLLFVLRLDGLQKFLHTFNACFGKQLAILGPLPLFPLQCNSLEPHHNLSQAETLNWQC